MLVLKHFNSQIEIQNKHFVLLFITFQSNCIQYLNCMDALAKICHVVIMKGIFIILFNRPIHSTLK